MPHPCANYYCTLWHVEEQDTHHGCVGCGRPCVQPYPSPWEKPENDSRSCWDALLILASAVVLFFCWKRRR